MNGSSSGYAHGSSGDQLSVEQYELMQQVAENESKMHEEYIHDILPKTSPLKIPNNATIKEETKTGYDQIKYFWEAQGYKYLSRWHTRTPNAPKDQTDTWVVEKTKPGVGSGPNASRKQQFVMTGRTSDGRPVWTTKKEWNAAIQARKNGTATQKQKEMLDHGHWKANK